MKFVLSLLVALATCAVLATAEARTYRWNWHLDSGTSASRLGRNIWMYNETVRRFKHPDVQAHLGQALANNRKGSLRETGVSGSLTWTLSLGTPRTERAWSNQGRVTRTCRTMRVSFVIEYRDWGKRDRRVRERNTNVNGLVCTANGGQTWYQDAPFNVRY